MNERQMSEHKFSAEEQFQIRAFEIQVSKMSREQAQELLVNLYRQTIINENLYEELLQHEWGLDEGDRKTV